MNKKIIKGIKIGVVSALSLAAVYFLYSMIAYTVIWLDQPRFISASGDTTASLGFFIQIFISLGAFLLLGAAITVTSILFFKKKKEVK